MVVSCNKQCACWVSVPPNSREAPDGKVCVRQSATAEASKVSSKVAEVVQPLLMQGAKALVNFLQTFPFRLLGTAFAASWSAHKSIDCSMVLALVNGTPVRTNGAAVHRPRMSSECAVKTQAF